MRFVVIGVGAIGGTVAGALALAGHDVAGIARGPHLAALQAGGLILHTVAGRRVARFPCFGDLAAADLRKDDVIMLAIKTQHTGAALEQLRAAGWRDQPVFCLQNGVENERLALRYGADVHGVTVMLPADHVTPGEVAAFGTPNIGAFHLGRWSGGSDAIDTAVAKILTGAGIASFVQVDVAASKYGKLLMNLGNVVEAALGSAARKGPLGTRIRAEGQAVLAAAGIAWRDLDNTEIGGGELMKTGEIKGVTRVGSSSSQSLARGAGSIETDYLNGEIVLLGGLHGIPTPVNAYFCRLAARMVREGMAPGSVPMAEVETALGA